MERVELPAPGGHGMKTRKVAEARAQFSSLIEEVRSSREAIRISRRDTPAAYLIGADEYERLQRLDDTVRTEQLRQALEGETYDLREVLRKLDLTSDTTG
jgi:prevent-host-death family protein